MMTNNWVTPRTPVGEALDIVPGAGKLFVRHGVDPTTTCARRMHEVRLQEAAEHCGLRDVDGLVHELNAVLAQVI